MDAEEVETEEEESEENMVEKAARLALERVHIMETMTRMLHTVMRFARSGYTHDAGLSEAAGLIFSALHRKQNEAYRDCMMWALGGINTDEVREEVARKFLGVWDESNEYISVGVMHHLDPMRNTPSRYQVAEDKLFRKQIAEAFRVDLPEDEE